MSAINIIFELDSLVAARHLLQHPFYQAWTTGTLSRSALRDYAAQYYRHVEAFPRYLSAIHSRCEDLPTRQTILENLIEEERGPRNHPELWMRFAEGVGVSRGEVRETRPNAATCHLIATYTRFSQTEAPALGLAALYVYESQMPAVAEAKLEGLRRFYGITDPDATAFFRVHREADAEHARTGAGLIEARTGARAEHDAVIAAADQALGALWSMLDGIRRD
jgi:pyrroloquinoline-quinone synthase